MNPDSTPMSSSPSAASPGSSPASSPASASGPFTGQAPVDLLDSSRTLTWVIYGLFAGGILTSGLSTIAGLIVAYVKRGQVAGTWLESHFQWLIRTFWISFGLTIAGVLLTFLLVGPVVLIGALIWGVYRLVVGALALNERQPIAEGKWGLKA